MSEIKKFYLTKEGLEKNKKRISEFEKFKIGQDQRGSAKDF